MKQITVVIPTNESGTLAVPGVITAITDVGLPGPRGDKGDTGEAGPQGPGISSNITRITASATPPDSPEVNDLWVDLS